MNGKVERLRRELAEAEKEAGVPVSGEPVAYQYRVQDPCGYEVWTFNPKGRPVLETKPLFAHPPHALAAAQAEVKRLRIDLEALAHQWSKRSDMAHPSDAMLINKHIRELRAALSTHADTSELDRLVADAGRAKWQPIETAPKDGTEFLGYRNGRIANAYRVQRDDCEMWSFGSQSGSVKYFPNVKPTHWMPLPDAPDAARAEVKS